MGVAAEVDQEDRWSEYGRLNCYARSSHAMFFCRLQAGSALVETYALQQHWSDVECNGMFF